MAANFHSAVITNFSDGAVTTTEAAGVFTVAGSGAYSGSPAPATLTVTLTINGTDYVFNNVTILTSAPSGGGPGTTVTWSVNVSNLAATLLTDGTFLATAKVRSTAGGGTSPASPGSSFSYDFPCFAHGTRLATPTGDAAVEDLAVGDMVLTTSGAAPVTWIGRRQINVKAYQRPEQAAPVRIQRGAFAENMPHRDLLVSPDHAIFVDGMLICARQLINGTTIRQETGIDSVEYFHIELESHSILLAEGLPAESYLDTGNRAFFANAGVAVTLRPDLTDESDHPAREVASCAPFVADEASVRPIWQRLADRASALGSPALSVGTTAEPALRVIANGKTIQPVSADAGQFTFVLPAGATEVRIASRSGVPTDASPWLNDRRQLGVQIKRIILRGSVEAREIPIDHPALQNGWWSVERDGAAIRRWTNGDAVLTLPEIAGPSVLELHLNGTMSYLTGQEDTRRAA